MTLAGKSCSRLPCQSKINDLLAEGRAVSHMQITEELACSSNTSLHSDGTTKFGHKYLGYQVATEERYFTVGIREVVTGSAQATLEQLTIILNELSHIASSSDVGNKILSSIKSTMSDRSSVECSFNDLLAEYRAKILPAVTHGWSELQEEEQLSLSYMYNFFCGMHLIVSMVEHTCEALKLFETAHFASKPAGSACNTFAYTSAEPGTIRLI